MSTTLHPILAKLTDSDVRVLLLELGQPGLLAIWERQRQIEFALDRLDRGERPRDIAARLCRKFGISSRTAYRRIDESLCHVSRYRGKSLVYDGPIHLKEFSDVCPIQTNPRSTGCNESAPGRAVASQSTRGGCSNS